MNRIALYLVSYLALSFAFHPPSPTELPAVFKNDLISLSIPLENDTLKLYTDTGGKNYLYKSGLKKLDTKRSKKNLWEHSKIEELFAESEIPIPTSKEIYFANDRSSTFDGMLGREWFADKIWEFDYSKKTLKHLEHRDENKENTRQSLRLYFKIDSLGNHTHHLPRIQIIVESDTLSMLLDTGAQAYLSKEAQRELHKNELVATSFINASTFNRWRNTHPDWKVIEKGDLSFGKKADLIIVPEILLGGVTVGPVEFVKRADSNFEVMSHYFMDQEIVGALGGNALSGLNKFVVDYENEELKIKN